MSSQIKTQKSQTPEHPVSQGVWSRVWSSVEACAQLFRRVFTKIKPLRTEKKTPTRRTLVKSVPTSLQDRYMMVDHSDLVATVFERLRRDVFHQSKVSVRGKKVFQEFGTLPGERSYFYLKPSGERGFLFEQTNSGWQVSLADKIVGKDLFLRDFEVLDRVNLFVSKEGKAFPRVKSAQSGEALLPFSVYEQKLKRTLGLEKAL